MDETALKSEASPGSTPADDDGCCADWSSLTLCELLENVLQTHHAFLRRHLPELQNHVMDVADLHGLQRPALMKLLGDFLEFRSAVESNLSREEEVLFPMIRRLACQTMITKCHDGMVKSRIRMAKHAHDETVSQFRSLLDVVSANADLVSACELFRTMHTGFVDLEIDFREHTAKEGVLFPKAIDTESCLSAKRA